MIVNRLPRLMAQKKLSIRELSRLTGITYTTIRGVYHSERRSVQLDVLDAICQILAVQPGEIYLYVPEGDDMVEPSADLPSQPEPRHGQSNQTPVVYELRKPGSDGWKNW